METNSNMNNTISNQRNIMIKCSVPVIRTSGFLFIILFLSMVPFANINANRHINGLNISFSRDSPPLTSTDSSCGYKQMKAKLGRRHVRSWKWVPFTNPARTDGAMLYHWRRAADEAKEYPFARFNKVGFHSLTVHQSCLLFEATNNF